MLPSKANVQIRKRMSPVGTYFWCADLGVSILIGTLFLFYECYNQSIVREERTVMKALLVVSFGTSYADSRKRTIEAVEQDLKHACPDRRFYHAYTSGIIRGIIEKNEGIHIPDVQEAVRQMIADGCDDLLVQPTHVIDGIENHEMKAAILAHRSSFQRIKIGAPLLHEAEDYVRAVHAVMEPIKSELDGSTAVFFMGHGTSHAKNSCYETLNTVFREENYADVYVGTVEALPDLKNLLSRISGKRYTRVLIQPFMLVAGDHAHNDMAGREEGTWRFDLMQAGYEVAVRIVGLGEHPDIRSIYEAHARAAMEV